MILMPEKMEQINILIHKQDVDKVADTLIAAGAVELVKASELEQWSSKLGLVDLKNSVQRYSDLADRASLIAGKLSIKILATQSEGPKEIEYIDNRIAVIEEKITSMEKETSELFLKKESLLSEKEKLEEMSRQVSALSKDFGKISTRSVYSFLNVQPGFIEERNLPILERYLSSIPHVVVPGRKDGSRQYVLIIILKSDSNVLARGAKESNFQNVDISETGGNISEEAVMNVKKRLEDIIVKINSIGDKLHEKKSEYQSELNDIIGCLHVYKTVARVRSYFRKTRDTFLISGWLPSAEKNRVVEALNKVTKGSCYIEEINPVEKKEYSNGDLNVPVKFHNPWFLRPFELLVTTYGVPNYRTIDPTLFVAVTYLIMFGMMFGDIGDGIILSFIGVYLGIFSKAKENIRNLGIIVLYCGISSVIFGVLYGSIFGIEHWLPAVWMRPLEHITDFFKISIYFGIAVVSIGILINVINAYLTGNLIDGILDKSGLLGGVIYWGSVGVICKVFVKGIHAVNPWIVILLIIFPVFVLFLKGPIIHLFDSSRPRFPEGILTYIMEHSIEILELFMGYLANTVSFIRVAAFALSHAGLFVAIFSLVDTVNKVTYGVHGILIKSFVFILGNIIVIVLEGLVVAIQCARLEYYEFFGKFFKHEGKSYKPVTYYVENQ
ncbi:MAG: V-type ATPase 116kDa subunit family protein [Candidatus Theseobacter exili]|nr:V-type ATPase 116kDa subunit family protein [Candidatus Theseobacter exili]